MTMLLITACHPSGQNPGTPTPAQPPANSTPPWSVSLDISGGIAGQMRNISVDQSGLAILTDKKTASRAEQSLSAQQVQALARLIETLPASKSGTRQSSQCRDCINYQLTAEFNGVKRRRVVQDIYLPESDAEALIQYLMALTSTMDSNR